MSLQALVTGGLLGPPAARARWPYCPQPHGVVVTAEARLQVGGRPAPSPRLLRMGAFTECTLSSLSNAANPQPGDFTQEESGCQEGKLEAWVPVLRGDPTRCRDRLSLGHSFGCRILWPGQEALSGEVTCPSLRSWEG